MALDDLVEDPSPARPQAVWPPSCGTIGSWQRLALSPSRGTGWGGQAAQVEVVGPPDDISTVRIGGRAITIIRGALSM
jgi:hypothetical protein